MDSTWSLRYATAPRQSCPFFLELGSNFRAEPGGLRENDLAKSSAKSFSSGRFNPIQLEELILKTMILASLLFISVVHSASGSVIGTVLDATNSNDLYINIKESNDASLAGVVHVILSMPVFYPEYFQGKDLRFDVIGHDILGRPVVEAYLGNARVQDLTVHDPNASSDVGYGEEGNSEVSTGGFSAGTANNPESFKLNKGIIDCTCFKTPTGAGFPRVYD